MLGRRTLRRSVLRLARDAGWVPLGVEEGPDGLTLHVAPTPGPQDPIGFFRALGARHPEVRLRVVAETTKPRR